MGKKREVADNVSCSDQVSHGFASSVSDNKTSKHNSRDAEVSTVSSERVHSANHTSIRSDVSSEMGRTLKENRKNLSLGMTEEISQGDSTIVAPYPHKQHKADSLSSKNSGAVGQLSSVDSADPKSALSLNNCGYSHPTQSVESKTVFQDPKCFVVTKPDPDAASLRSSHYAFDLNEGIEANAADCLPKSIHESNHSGNAVLSEPIPVVAKVGVPIGLPRKPLQFGGDLGWKRSGIVSAFRSTPLTNSDTEKAHVPKGLDVDLNIAPAMDPEILVDQPSMYVSSKEPERFHFVNRMGSENHHRPSTSSIDLNNNPMIEEGCKTIDRQDETRQLLPVTCSVGSPSPYTSTNYGTPPYWVDLSSVRGFGNVQEQPFLLGGHTKEQDQIMVPIQLPYTPPGLYFGKMTGLTPTFYPSNVLPPFHNQIGVGPIQQIPAHVLAAYPGNVRLPESSQGMNLNTNYPHAYTNMRPTTVLSNGRIALMENGGWTGNSSEYPTPSRNNPLLGERMNLVEQVSYPASSVKRQESDEVRDASQINCRQMTSWN